MGQGCRKITKVILLDFSCHSGKETLINDSLYNTGLDFKPILSQCEFSPWF